VYPLYLMGEASLIFLQGYTGTEYQSLWRAVHSLERKGKVLTKRTWIYKPECRNKDLRVELIEALQRLKSGVFLHLKKE
jgi:beta-mannanase